MDVTSRLGSSASGVALGFALLLVASASPAAGDRDRIAFVVAARDPGPISWIAEAGPAGNVRRLATPRPRAGSSRRDSMPAWSPDGRRLAFLRREAGRSGVFVVGRSGAPRRVAAGVPRYDLVWSPNGLSVAFGESQRCHATLPRQVRIAIAGADGSGWRTFAGLPAPAAFVDGISELAWSPDGTRLAYVVHYASGPDFSHPPACHAIYGESELYVVGIDGSDRVLIVRGQGEFIEALAWSPDSARIAYSVGFGDSTIYVADASGMDAPLRLGPAKPFDGSVGSLAWTPDGRSLLSVGERGLHSHSTATGARRRLLAWGRKIADVSSDGQRVAVVRDELREGVAPSVYTVHLRDGSVRKTSLATPTGRVEWGPDVDVFLP